MSHHDPDEVIPRTCDESRLPAHVRQPVPTLQRQLAAYPTLREEMRSAVEPRLLMLNDQAYVKALNRVLTGMGLDKGHVTVPSPVDAAPATPQSGGIVIGFGNPFNLIRRLFHRGG